MSYSEAMRRGDIIGGAYNEHKALVQRGHTPTARIVPFDDGVGVIQGSDVNLYDAGSWNGTLEVTNVGGYNSTEVFFKFAQPVNDIRIISFPWVGGEFSAGDSSSEFNTAQTGIWSPRIGMNLMRFDMNLGEPLGLDALTGVNAAWGENSSAHGSILYATPSNFDSFIGFGAELWSAPIAIQVFDIIGGTTRMTAGSPGWADDPDANNLPMLTVGFSVPKTDGPYFGIHVFYHSSVFGGDPIFSWVGTIDYTIKASLLSPRSVLGVIRGHVIASDLLSF